ncbi:uncharacterized protein LOC132727163 isoform X3 [Ruditapes philippinarum]|uniref:uncharacterized protein LOC132727163 isoform X3 n=1 Tax=Ruditapes philippinarum TaxID=129788 RepID=UPI00295C0F38|nr:uncharacterized protein LOC132727163 isoform X3 [Ruditapes philippinarum]
MDSPVFTETDPFTVPKQVFDPTSQQVKTKPDTTLTLEINNPYTQVGSSTADLLSQDSVQSSGYMTLEFDPQRNMDVESNGMRNKDCESTGSSAGGVDKQCVSKCSFYIITALAILATLIASVSIMLTINLWSKYEELNKKLNETQVSYSLAQQDLHTCLPCAELSQGPFEEENEDLKQLIKREENGVPTCCAKTAAQFSTILNLFAKRKRMESCAQESLEKENITASCNLSTPSSPGIPPARANGSISAHLVMGEKQSGKGDEYHPIRHWRQGLPGTHMSYIRMKSENSRIIVPETGLYYLYSQAGFLIYYDNNDENTHSTQSLFHAIYRYNAIYPLDGNEELMRSVITQCWEKQKDYGRYTSYVGAAVRLHKGDELYVKVSRIQDVTTEASRTYFGMFKL